MEAAKKEHTLIVPGWEDSTHWATCYAGHWHFRRYQRRCHTVEGGIPVTIILPGQIGIQTNAKEESKVGIFRCGGRHCVVTSHLCGTLVAPGPAADGIPLWEVLLSDF